ncbi:extracellular glycosyl hydrolase family 78 protein [Pseudomassariella vexata]|uniref:alpha-L-rhamnosidase n=1 Tax=Pseudomassariella vexata TaxID=1141098 RepID=A0A1Y2DW25_9PEZI|nr:extracellular glycosyl hydrolase family 78 protein [Pseudomassariella vexata]ORY63457.1 extracellular glycosyl hydrolase family 78 protein [Pseudomassariella vexata]
MAVSVSHVSFEHHASALGIGETEPRISWRFDGNAPNWTQSGYSIEVSRGAKAEPELFDFNSSDSVLVPWPTVSLASAEAATIRIRAYGAGDSPPTDWSDAFTVETGLLNEEVWEGAMMIAADKETEKDAPHQPVLLRKEFPVEEGIGSVRLYITSYGLYEAYINGKRVGNAVLAPGWQSYDHRLVYDTYDVTHLLDTGTNAIGIQVGEGWYSSRLGWNGGDRNIWGDTLGAMALLVIKSADGTKQTVSTDLSWQSGIGAILTSEIYDGENYDARLEQPGWATTEFDPSDWIGVKKLEAPYKRLVAPDGPPIRRMEEVELQEIFTSASGKTILDFGQNLVGWLRLKVDGPEGQSIRMVHTEVLENGEVATRPLRNATQTDTLTLAGKGVQTWEPAFTYHGFRYVQVDGWPTDSTPLDNNAVTAIVVHSDMQETGSFECSNALLNKLHQNVRWSMKGNFMSIPTDCPQRDERLGWTGDAHAFSPTANFLYDTSGFWRGWMKDVSSEQMANQSIPPVIVPVIPVVSSGGTTPTAVWGDVVVANPWNAYIASGDLIVLREQYKGAKAWLDTGIPRSEVGLWNHSYYQYGDWLDPLSPPDDPGNATTSSSLVSDAYLVYVTNLVAKMASALGLKDDAVYYSDWAAKIKTAFGNAWISADGMVANETQTGLTLPLFFDLFANDDHSAAAAERLQKIIADNEYLVGTGFAGTHLLGLTLTNYNLTSTFYRMILQTTVPSWLYQVVMNGTTTWERWDSMLANGTVNPGSMTSFNHYAFGSVANWIHQVVGGLAPAEPGWKTAKVNVVPGGNITEAKASYLSPYGTVSTDWKVDRHGFQLKLVVPPNMHADVTLPGSEKVKRVGSGRHEFSIPGYRMEG